MMDPTLPACLFAPSSPPVHPLYALAYSQRVALVYHEPSSVLPSSVATLCFLLAGRQGRACLQRRKPSLLITEAGRVLLLQQLRPMLLLLPLLLHLPSRLQMAMMLLLTPQLLFRLLLLCLQLVVM